MNREMSAAQLKEHIIDFLREHKQASLATCADNIPRSSPVQYFLGQNTDIFILSAGGDKFKNLEHNSNVCLLVNKEYINYRQIKGVQVFGRAYTSIETPELYNEAKKYSPDSHLMENEKASLKVIKIVPHEIVYLDSIQKGDRTKQVLRGEQVEVR